MRSYIAASPARSAGIPESRRSQEMMIRHPSVIKLAGLGLSWLLRRWVGTLGVRYRNLSEHDVEPRLGNTAGPYLFALWHQDIFPLTARYAGPHLCTMISEHA